VSDAPALLRDVHRLLGDRAAEAADPRVTVGARVVLVELGHPDHGRLAGVAHRPRGSPPDAWPATAAELASLAVESSARLRRAVGVATLNALSAPDVEWLPGDPMAALSPAVSVVATVGLFRPAFRKFADVDVRVVERDPPAAAAIDAPPGVTTATFAPDACATAFEGADVCFVTGSTLVYGGIDGYLDALTAAAVPLVVLVGSTASFLPTPAFSAGVDVLAGASVTDPDRVRARAVDGDCDTDLHGDGLRKGYVAARDSLPGLTLRTNANTHDQ
jgi:hypothetical protein